MNRAGLIFLSLLVVAAVFPAALAAQNAASLPGILGDDPYPPRAASAATKTIRVPLRSS